MIKPNYIYNFYFYFFFRYKWENHSFILIIFLSSGHLFFFNGYVFVKINKIVVYSPKKQNKIKVNKKTKSKKKKN